MYISHLYLDFSSFAQSNTPSKKGQLFINLRRKKLTMGIGYGIVLEVKLPIVAIYNE